MCAFRRRDISLSLLSTLEKHQNYMLAQPTTISDTEDETQSSAGGNFQNSSNNDSLQDEFSDSQKGQLKHRELFYSKYTEQIPTSIIRGKCVVHLFTQDIDTYNYYLNNEVRGCSLTLFHVKLYYFFNLLFLKDAFYYQLTYDPNQKTLLADKGEIRVGNRYQAEVPKTIMSGNHTDRKCDELIWNPNECKLNEEDFKKYIVLVQSIGTYGRALGHNSDYDPPNSLISAKDASRDITISNAHMYLHQAQYNLTTVLKNFTLPEHGSGPVLFKDELEDWSTIETKFFEEGLEKFGKDFYHIKNELLPWKTLRSVVEYYYMWKTTDRYVTRKRLKETQDHKLPQIYIPNV